MKYEVSANCCRICLTKSKKQRSLYKPFDEGDEPPNEMLQKLTGIVVEKMEKFTMLPKNICKNCELSLSMAYEFREKALQSQETIESYMRELQILYQVEEKPEFKANDKEKYFKEEDDHLIEVHQLEETTLEDNLQVLENNDTSHHHLDELQIPEKCENDYDDEVHGTEEFTEEALDDAETYVAEENVEIHSFTPEEMQEQQYEEMVNDVDDVNDMVHIVNEAEDEIEEQQQYDDEMQHEYLSEKENTRTSWELAVEEIEIGAVDRRQTKRKPQKSTKKPKLSKNVNYMCDICGNVYAKRGRMMEHRQRHDKELKYSCELCDEKFHMRELLRKHMYSHSGGKPLKCKYCSRTFYYESVRKAHEAVHQGVKPYICDVCGKAFSYSHSLKKHKLIHEEVKLYRCDYCNKDFRLQHHMKQHKLTRLHKKAVNLAEGHYDENNITSTDLDNDDDLSEDVLMEEEELDEEEEHITNVS